MTESGLTTQREREAFTALVNEFLERDLPNAPREQLQDIERFIRSWKPVADHRRVDGGLYGTHGSRHLVGRSGMSGHFIDAATVAAARGITGLMGVAVLAWLWVRLL